MQFGRDARFRTPGQVWRSIQTLRRAMGSTIKLLLLLLLYTNILESEQATSLSGVQWPSSGAGQDATQGLGHALHTRRAIPLERWLARELSGQCVAVEVAALETDWQIGRGQCMVRHNFLPPQQAQATGSVGSNTIGGFMFYNRLS